MILLKTVGSHLSGAAGLLREARVDVRQAAEEHEAELERLKSEMEAETKP